METGFSFDIHAQPTLTTCGPTCLHAVYRYFGDEISLEDVIAQSEALPTGGTLAVLLGCHALSRGYRARIYTYNLQVFDPSWFRPGCDLALKLREQAKHKRTSKLRFATEAYLRFLARGGELRFHDLEASLLRKFLKRGLPVLTGLSATYLYRESRERGDDCQPDDLRGEPSGHFVVVCGVDADRRQVQVADPLHPNPLAPHPVYRVSYERLIGAILLGTLTFDANLLILEPEDRSARSVKKER